MPCGLFLLGVRSCERKYEKINNPKNILRKINGRKRKNLTFVK